MFTRRVEQAPTATVIAAPGPRTTSRIARIAWVASGPAGTFVCTVDGVEQPCTRPLVLTGVSVGDHFVSISGRGPAGQTTYFGQQPISWTVVGAPGVKEARAAAAVPPRVPDLWGGPGPRESAGHFELGLGRLRWGHRLRVLARRCAVHGVYIAAPGQWVGGRGAHVRGAGVQRGR